MGAQGTAGSASPTIMVCSSDHKIFTSHGDCDGVPIPITVDNLAPGSQIIDLSVNKSPDCTKKRIPRYGSKKDIIAAFKCNQITK
jgi:peroxiredoxin